MTEAALWSWLTFGHVLGLLAIGAGFAIIAFGILVGSLDADDDDPKDD